MKKKSKPAAVEEDKTRRRRRFHKPDVPLRKEWLDKPADIFGEEDKPALRRRR